MLLLLSLIHISELELLLTKYTDMNHRFELLNGYAYKSEVTGILKGLGFQEEEFQKKVDTLSGGQKTRIALGKLLLQKPDLIILDEPTNHLDLNSCLLYTSYILYSNMSKFWRCISWTRR